MSAIPNEGFAGTEVTLSAPATALEGARTFSHWVVTDGDGSVSGNILTLGETDVTVEAVYVESPMYNVQIEVQPTGAARATTANPSVGYPGQLITLTATPQDGYEFDSWTVLSGGVTIDENNQFVLGDSDVQIRANFVMRVNRITLTSQSVDSSELSAIPSEGVVGTEVTLSAPATAQEGDLIFSRWEVIEGAGYIEGNILTLGSTDVTVEAIYVEVPIHNVQIIVQPEGAAIQATANPSSGVSGQLVTLTATPAERYEFDSWTVLSGGVTIDENNQFVIGDSDVQIQANFVQVANFVDINAYCFSKDGAPVLEPFEFTVNGTNYTIDRPHPTRLLIPVGTPISVRVVAPDDTFGDAESLHYRVDGGALSYGTYISTNEAEISIPNDSPVQLCNVSYQCGNYVRVEVKPANLNVRLLINGSASSSNPSKNYAIVDDVLSLDISEVPSNVTINGFSLRMTENSEPLWTSSNVSDSVTLTKDLLRSLASDRGRFYVRLDYTQS